jgi:hypothetical protein
MASRCFGGQGITSSPKVEASFLLNGGRALKSPVEPDYAAPSSEVEALATIGSASRTPAARGVREGQGAAVSSTGHRKPIRTIEVAGDIAVNGMAVLLAVDVNIRSGTSLRGRNARNDDSRNQHD